MDLLLIETYNGGDLRLKGNDLEVLPGWGNMPYLAMFGGNVEASTKVRQPQEQVFDWWGNDLLMSQDTSVQFNSYTEKALKDTPLTSAGRVKIQQAVEKDLVFMKEFAIINVIVSIVDVNKVRIQINVKQPSDTASQYKAVIFIWDGTLQSLDGDFSIFDFNNDFF